MADDKLERLEQDVSKIKERNVRVESEKAWEGSITRIGVIMIITYTIACIVLYAIDNDHPFRNALIPTLGFFLSTQSIPFLKKQWIRSYMADRSK
jgi:hypothetical protein